MPRCLSFEFLRTQPDDTGRYQPFCCGNRTGDAIIKKWGIPFSFHMGGIYDSVIKTVDGEDLSNQELTTDMDVRIVWQQATFIGRHFLLGDIIIELNNLRSFGTLAPVDISQNTVFPAINRNEFFFRISLPRLGRQYVNRDPLVNKAVIKSIPPIGALYTLEKPVRFENVVDPDDWTNITKCYVMMPDQKYVNIDVISIIQAQNRYKVTATLENVSPKRFVIAYWFTNSDEPFTYHYEPAFGIVALGRQKKTIHFDMVYNSQPADPVIQLGAALIINPIVNDPDRNSGTEVAAFNVNRRQQFFTEGGVL